jgi:hypothetical protein
MRSLHVVILRLLGVVCSSCFYHFWRGLIRKRIRVLRHRMIQKLRHEAISFTYGQSLLLPGTSQVAEKTRALFAGTFLCLSIDADQPEAFGEAERPLKIIEG